MSNSPQNISDKAMAEGRKHYEEWFGARKRLDARCKLLVERIGRLIVAFDPTLEDAVAKGVEKVHEMDLEKRRRPSGLFDHFCQEFKVFEMAKEIPVLKIVIPQARRVVAVYDEQFDIAADKKCADFQLVELAKARMQYAADQEVFNHLSAQSDLLKAEIEVRKLEYRPSLKIANMAFDGLDHLWEMIDSDEGMDFAVQFLKGNWDNREQILEALMQHPAAAKILPVLKKMGVPLPSGDSAAQEDQVSVEIDGSIQKLTALECAEFLCAKLKANSPAAANLAHEMCVQLSNCAEPPFRTHVLAKLNASDEDRKRVAGWAAIDISTIDTELCFKGPDGTWQVAGLEETASDVINLWRQLPKAFSATVPYIRDYASEKFLNNLIAKLDAEDAERQLIAKEFGVDLAATNANAGGSGLRRLSDDEVATQVQKIQEFYDLVAGGSADMKTMMDLGQRVDAISTEVDEASRWRIYKGVEISDEFKAKLKESMGLEGDEPDAANDDSDEANLKSLNSDEVDAEVETLQEMKHMVSHSELHERLKQFGDTLDESSRWAIYIALDWADLDHGFKKSLGLKGNPPKAGE